jgi:ribosomal protein S12 methylthiotransferase accessory factor
MIEINFPGGEAVDAVVKGRVVHTDQSEVTPFDLFLASLAACAGYYALRFCQQRGIDTDGLGVTLSAVRGESKRLETVRIDLRLPPAFPEKYRDAVLRAVDQCAVKKAILDPPRFDVVLA